MLNGAIEESSFLSIRWLFSYGWFFSFFKSYWKCCSCRAKTMWNYIQDWPIPSNLLFYASEQRWSVGTLAEELWGGSVVADPGHSGTWSHPRVPRVCWIWRPDKSYVLCELGIVAVWWGPLSCLGWAALPGGDLLTLPKYFDWSYLHWHVINLRIEDISDSVSGVSPRAFRWLNHKQADGCGTQTWCWVFSGALLPY